MIETYVPLYRKYRPQSLGDLVGQEVVATALGNAIALGKIAHAYLFCGPRGTGKTSSARILAKSLNCEQGPTATPCQTCASCTSITQGNALDVTELDAASNNGVDDIREITEKVQFAAMLGRYKIYIIDEVHMLTTAAFNALLKTLEEPPPNVVFIFATTEPHKVLATIISRCQRFDFARITRQHIEQRITDVATQEQITITPEAVTLIARHARGGMRDALSLLDQVSVLGRASGQAVTPETVRTFIGAMPDEVLLALTQAIQTQQPQDLLAQVRVLQEKGIESTQLVKELTQHFRNLLLAKTCGPSASGDSFDIAQDLYLKLVDQAVGFSVEEIPQLLARLSTLEYQIRNSHQPQLWLEIALVELCYRTDMALVQDLAQRVAQLEQALGGGAPLPARAVHSAPVASQSTPPPTPKVVASPPPVVTPPPATEVNPPAAAPEPVPAVIEPVVPAPAVTESVNAMPSEVSMAPVVAESMIKEESQPAIESASPEGSVPPPVTPQVLPQSELQSPATPPARHGDASPSPVTSPSGDLWGQVLGVIAHVPTKSMIQDPKQFHLLDVTEQDVVIGYTAPVLCDLLQRDTTKMGHLQAAVQQVLGRTVKITFKASDAKSAKSVAPAAKPAASVQSVSPSLPPRPVEPEPALALETPISAEDSVIQQVAQASAPRFEDIPPPVAPVASDGAPQPVSVAPSGNDLPLPSAGDEPPAEIDFDLEQAKQYTQELLQGRVLDS